MNPSHKGDTRFIFVTGGVVSALGKGIAAASIGRLLVSRGPSTGEFALRTCAGTSEALVQTLHQIRIGLDETFIGHAAATGEVRQAPKPATRG